MLADPRAAAGFRPEWKELVYPLICDRSSGSRIWDIDGNEYIDLVNGYGPTAFGHSPDFVVEAIKEQLEKGFATGPQAELAGEVAALFTEMTGNERMTFCNTGSEAVMAALRVARAVTGRDKVVMFNGAYHGQFDEVLVRSARRPGGPPRSAPIAAGILQSAVENMVVLDYGDAGIARLDPAERQRSGRGHRRAGAEPPSRSAAVRVSARASRDHGGCGRRLRHGRDRHRLPHASRRHASRDGNPGRSGDLRQGDRRRAADRHPCRQGEIHGRPRRRPMELRRRVCPRSRRRPSSPAPSFAIPSCWRACAPC